MMAGQPPVEREKLMPVQLSDGNTRDELIFEPLPSQYSEGLRAIVWQMLSVDRDERPTSADLSVSVDQGMRIWRETTPEGKIYVRKGDMKRSKR